VTRFSLLLAACTATLGLAAGPPAQDNPRSSFRPIELQIGASFMGYDSQDTSWEWGKATVSPKGLGLAPSFRLMFEPIALPFGGLGFTASYRMTNDVPLQYGDVATNSNLRHKSQIALGAILRVGVTDNFDFGVGYETRNDWMRASRMVGSESEHTVWRPWLRLNARYLFDSGTNITPFVGAEAGFALAAVEVNQLNYYRDFVMNTGDAFLGPVDRPVISPESFAKGHMPIWEAALVGGVRFGRHGVCGQTPAAKPKAEKPKTEKPKADGKPQPRPEVNPGPLPGAIPVPVPKVSVPGTVPAAEPKPVAESKPVAEVKPEPAAKADVIEIEGIRIHFITNDSASAETNNRTIVKTWAAKYKSVVDPKDLVVTGHADKRGSHAHNMALSVRRANTLAGYLRAEGVNIPAANVQGRSWDEPIADNDTQQGLAKNRRAELGVNGPKYRIKSMMEGNIVGLK